MEQIKLFKRYSNDSKNRTFCDPSTGCTEQFEDEVNQWLLDNKDSIKVKDIKYTSFFPDSKNAASVTWTVMVIYDTEK